MTLAVLLQVVVMCMYHIEPKMDRDYCAQHMVSCINQGGTFDSCSDYWEPMDPGRDYSYGGDPSEADWSY